MTSSETFGHEVEAIRHLKSSTPFGNLSDDVLEQLAQRLEPVTALAGESIMTEGEPPSDAFIIIAGRLAVLTGGAGERPGIVAELKSGDVVGEMSLLSGDPHSATVQAMRDSLLLRLSGDDFKRIVLANPEVLLDVTRAVVLRLNRSIHGELPKATLSVIGVIPAGRAPGHREFVADFARVAVAQRRAVVIDSQRVADEIGPDASVADITSHLQRLERDSELMLLVADESATSWTELCIRQADLVLLVGRASGLAVQSDAEAATASPRGEDRRSAVHLVVLHESESPSGTPALLASRTIDRHHHVRIGSEAHLERLARVLAGNSIGAVLSGGGARGFAHLGIIKALQEAAIPIDHIAGASMGAVMASSYAIGWDWSTMLEMARGVTVDQGSLVDLSFPAVALARGNKLTSGMRQGYGGMHIEDLWTDFFCLSTDLTSNESRVHRAGPLWRAVRASVAIPGVFPPVRSADGHVLVDGGVLNNLPTDVMRQTFRPATMIAVDLRAPLHVDSSDLSEDGIVSGWQVAGRRYAPWKTPMKVPHIADLLSSSTSVSGSHNAELADLVFRPPVEGFGVLEFHSYAQIVETGYRHALDVLAGWEPPQDIRFQPARSD